MQTKILAEFALALTYQDLPARAVTMAKQCVEDLIGVALAGSATEQGRIWHTYFSRRTDGLQAAAWMPGFPGLAWREAGRYYDPGGFGCGQCVPPFREGGDRGHSGGV